MLAYVITWRAGDPSQHRKRPLHNELYLDSNMRTTRLLKGMAGEGRARERETEAEEGVEHMGRREE